MKLLLILLGVLSTASATTVECVFAFFTAPLTGRAYTCVLNNFDFNETAVVSRVTGDHIQDMGNDDVKFLLASSSYPEFIFDISNIFRKLTGINQAFSRLASLDGTEFDRYENLEFVSLSDNPIKHIPGNLFSQNSNMKKVVFSRCQISTVGERFLDTLSHFEVAQFALNNCINQNAENSQDIPGLIINLRFGCAIPEDQITTTIRTTTLGTTAPGEQNCNLYETVCVLKVQNQILIRENEQINARLDVITESLNEMKVLINQLLSRPCSV